MSALAHVGYDPLKDKSYAATRLGRSVVDFLAWMELGHQLMQHVRAVAA